MNTAPSAIIGAIHASQQKPVSADVKRDCLSVAAADNRGDVDDAKYLCAAIVNRICMTFRITPEMLKRIAS